MTNRLFEEQTEGVTLSFVKEKLSKIKSKIRSLSKKSEKIQDRLEDLYMKEQVYTEKVSNLEFSSNSSTGVLEQVLRDSLQDTKFENESLKARLKILDEERKESLVLEDDSMVKEFSDILNSQNVNTPPDPFVEKVISEMQKAKNSLKDKFEPVKVNLDRRDSIPEEDPDGTEELVNEMSRAIKEANYSDKERFSDSKSEARLVELKSQLENLKAKLDLLEPAQVIMQPVETPDLTPTVVNIVHKNAKDVLQEAPEPHKVEVVTNKISKKRKGFGHKGFKKAEGSE